MLFDQYGNYVVQTMLNVAIDVRSGNRMGDINWFVIGVIHSSLPISCFMFSKIVGYVFRNQQMLRRYSSGKNIIEKVQNALGSGRSSFMTNTST